MATKISPTMEGMPLHVVAGILAQLDTMRQLATTILSHRIFNAAFKDNLHSVSQGIIMNQIPERVLPFSLALLESTRVVAGDTQGVPLLVMNLKKRIANPHLAANSLSGLTLSDYSFLSKTQAAVQSLSASISKEALPGFAQRFGAEKRVSATAEETFRLNRAFYRYQIMCNLFCTHRNTDEELCEEERKMTFLGFSPWVNEQLLCVYSFLERAVTKAYESLAAHDIEWGELPVDWDSSAEENPRIQWFLRNGLEFLSSVAKAQTYDERARLLRLNDFEPVTSDFEPFEQLNSMFPDEDWLDAIDLDAEMMLSNLEASDMLGRLTGALDGPNASASSSPFRTWLATHSSDPVYSAVFNLRDRNLWECGYVLWDAEEVSEEQLRDRGAAVRQMEPLFPRLRASWSDEAVRRSEKMRTDLYLAGGRGYWPKEGLDFTAVRGLSEEKKQDLLGKWEQEGK